MTKSLIDEAAELAFSRHKDALVERIAHEGRMGVVEATLPGNVADAEFAAQSNSRPSLPIEAYGQWQSAYSFFNERLFEGKLPDCMITLTRKSFVAGYFCAGIFVNRNGHVVHEIAMNPEWLGVRGDTEDYSTLVHEMCHLERHHGPPNRKGGKGARGYHDKVWAEGMLRVGLMPFAIGDIEQMTGYAVSHRIIKGGPFDLACRELLAAGLVVDWRDVRALRRTAATGSQGPAGGAPDEPAPKPRNTRARFVCSGCDVRAWARRSARLSCIDCSQPLVPK